MANLQAVRANICNALQGVSGGGWVLSTGRIFVGYCPVTHQSGGSWWTNCVSGESGACAFVEFGGVSSDGSPETRNAFPEFECLVNIYLAIDKDAACSGSGIVTFIESARVAIHAAVYGMCTYEPPRMRMVGPVLLLHYSLHVSGTMCGS